MQITLNIPEELAARVIPDGKDPAQAALEALAIDGYRMRRLNESQIKDLLGYSSRMQVHALLKEYDVYLDYSMDDLKQDLEAANRLKPQTHRAA